MNPNPTVFESQEKNEPLEFENGKLINVSPLTIFELVRNINDPEHPQTLEQLGVVSLEKIKIYDDIFTHEKLEHPVVIKNINVKFKPTIPYCSMASLIGLAIKIQLYTYVSLEYHITVELEQDSHVQEIELNKQLNDKDRVFAAMKNENVMELVNELLVQF